MEQAEQVFNKIIDNNITPSLGTCILKMQDTYKEAEKFLMNIFYPTNIIEELEQVKLTDYNDLY